MDTKDLSLVEEAAGAGCCAGVSAEGRRGAGRGSRCGRRGSVTRPDTGCGRRRHSSRSHDTTPRADDDGQVSDREDSEPRAPEAPPARPRVPSTPPRPNAVRHRH
ncbi:hypothetical protein JYU34_013553 [Plutella xylostella]|uniref:Uncharacterized protein n=1 Tax=Plutella xylostella TaxID=51655 RepID=A0ABQ7QDS0_PLUXY|nr:hypothetical protein JYU34_013553 [Plutella xylostella]